VGKEEGERKNKYRTERIISLGGGVTTAVTYAQKPPPPNKWLHFARQRSTAAAAETAAVRRALWGPKRGGRPPADTHCRRQSPRQFLAVDRTVRSANVLLDLARECPSLFFFPCPYPCVYFMCVRRFTRL